jgi:hypothetical protein
LFVLLLAITCGLLLSAEHISTKAQTGDPTAKLEPSFREYKGVSLGMTTDETRKKLGAPEDKGEEQDFYVFSDKESAQIYYDKTKHVDAISINYVGETPEVPKAKAVLGTDVEIKPDGSMHKLVRFPKAGCWISYSRTAGNDPLITITVKKL